jgi:hypothetical protein
MMRHITQLQRYALIVLIVLSLLLGGAAWARARTTQTPTIVQRVLGSGGTLTQGSTTVSYTVGQSLVGTNRRNDKILCAGFWCQDATTYSTFIPLVLKDV